MCAATVAGIYPTIDQARAAMGSGFDTEYAPDPTRSQVYDRMYDRYRVLGAFVEEQTAQARRKP
jgi:L-ribulokinase